MSFYGMIRKMTLVLSLATEGVGVFLIVREQAVNAPCNPHSSPTTGTGISINCEKVMSFYFLDQAMIVGGLMITLLALFVLAKRDSEARELRAVRKIYRLHQREEETHRKAA
jgi:hypothetical protein